MKPKASARKWIFLVLLLIISVTFLFLQLLSFKAIDSTVRNMVIFLHFYSQDNINIIVYKIPSLLDTILNRCRHSKQLGFATKTEIDLS